MTQKKLLETEKEKCQKIASILIQAFCWQETPEGYGHWAGLRHRFLRMAEYGTSDGKPWVEPEPPIPEGWRKANDDEWERTDVRFWLPAAKEWRFRKHNATQFDPQSTGILYIVPIEPLLTDRDACVWPRPLVMTRDKESDTWKGPFELHGVCDGSAFPFEVMEIHEKIRAAYIYARRATSEEIEAAK